MIQALIELDEFFMQRGKLFQTLEKLARNLDQAGIDYAVVGGIALVIHGYVRATQDIDVLLTPEGLQAFQQQLVGRGFIPAFSGAQRMFKDSDTGVVVEFLVSGEFPGDGKPKPIAFPIPTLAAINRDGIRVIQLNTLIELKLASGLSAADRLKDLADVQELIRTLNLPRDLASQLNPAVQSKFTELWDAIDQARPDRPALEP